jgi:hypothetical protein
VRRAPPPIQEVDVGRATASDLQTPAISQRRVCGEESGGSREHALCSFDLVFGSTTPPRGYSPRRRARSELEKLARTRSLPPVRARSGRSSRNWRAPCRRSVLARGLGTSCPNRTRTPHACPERARAASDAPAPTRMTRWPETPAVMTLGGIERLCRVGGIQETSRSPTLALSKVQLL